MCIIISPVGVEPVNDTSIENTKGKTKGYIYRDEQTKNIKIRIPKYIHPSEYAVIKIKAGQSVEFCQGKLLNINY